MAESDMAAATPKRVYLPELGGLINFAHDAVFVPFTVENHGLSLPRVKICGDKAGFASYTESVILFQVKRSHTVLRGT